MSLEPKDIRPNMFLNKKLIIAILTPMAVIFFIALMVALIFGN